MCIENDLVIIDFFFASYQFLFSFNVAWTSKAAKIISVKSQNVIKVYNLGMCICDKNYDLFFL